MMTLFRYLLIGLTLAALVAIGVEIYTEGLPTPSAVLIVVGITCGLILNAIYLVLNRPSGWAQSAQPSTGAVNVKALAYIGTACVVAWFAVDIGVKIHQEQRLTARSYGGLPSARR
jgi:hypothetical protein